MLKIWTQILNEIRARMGSQWSCQRARVMWSLGLNRLTKCAALWRIVVYGWSVLSGRLIKMVLSFSQVWIWLMLEQETVDIFSLRQRFIWRIRRRWKQQDLATEEMWSLVTVVSHWQCVVEISKIALHVWVWIKGRDKGYGYKVWTTTSQQQEVNNQPLVILSF